MTFFEFEADFVDSLRCIPMQVRCKLDTCGIKLKLSDWSHLTTDERETLVQLPCSTEAETQAYKEYLQNLIIQRTGTAAAELPTEENPAWTDAHTIPINVQEKAKEFHVTLSPQQWTQLTPLQRFALIKLSRPSHENQNFPKALKEFHLL